MATMILLLLLVLSNPLFKINGHDFTIEEATIEDVHRAFTEKKLTSRQLVDYYLNRIESLNPLLRGVIELNPDAMHQADRADLEREGDNRSRPSLHGIPVLLKDSIGTKDELNTTAGSYALLGAVVPRDAGVVERLRNGGAVILGKASMSEWYQFRSLSIRDGWCGRGGQGVNPYVKGGNPCGSSSGSAISVAANMVMVSLGTETDGSLICPGDHNSVVALKPTVGLTSRAGVIPLSPRQDTIGPICRTVSDAAYVLDSIVGFDPRDSEATKAAAKFIPLGGYTQFLNKDGLNGKRLGVLKDTFVGLSNISSQNPVFEAHLQTLRERGATIVDNLEIPNIDAILNPLVCGESTALLAEFKLALNDYLKELITSPVRSLSDIITFNQNHPDLERSEELGQDILIAADSTNGIGEDEKQAIETMEKLSRDGFEKLMLEKELDAIVTMGSDFSSVLAIGGFPGITVPAGYDPDGMPFGICFGGLKGTEPTLLEIAYAFEQATLIRRPPSFKSFDLAYKDIIITLNLSVYKEIWLKPLPFLSFQINHIQGTRFPQVQNQKYKIRKKINMEKLEKFTIEEATIAEIQQAFAQGKLTARQLVDFYLHQIESLNPVLRGVIEVNPDAQQLADESDREKKERSKNGERLDELHGIPVLLKDTIGTHDKLNTTAGSYALLGSKVTRDATVVERLRKAGAIVLGKASLSEWYKFRSLSHLPNGWCARAGQGVNPYVHSGTPCGSSSGSAISVAANMVSVALGTETHSSIICPSDHNSVVGLKPTVGLTSRSGIIPMTPRWDTIGPICRTVSDAVYVLDVIAGLDPRDEATIEGSKFIPEGGYKQFLNENGLNGKRLGVVRHPFVEKIHDTAELAAFERHLITLRERGAEVIDNLKIDHVEKILDPNHSGEASIMMVDFKTSINVYLKELVHSPVHSLADIIAFNESNVELEKLTEYDQDTFIEAEKTDGLGDHEKAILEKLEDLSCNGFEKLMKENELDAMVTPGSRACPVLAIGGYPAITVPAGYESDGMPFGICFGGLKGTEPKIIEISYAFEKATRVRRPPSIQSS
ncbi:hypothetical protein BUALT_Bualt15G0014000 [Buddleja alternifolia]|uniref:Amidase domain-containing protein n=1 Tax=Buddleja alternifolia TaxID=168488 RepID=A0AAV6WDH7_9LAMI|nr:hypothetical protein BUALT_Bualt15G0014000 [Buddleja alternifolia]